MLSLLPMLMRMLLCTVITMVDTILIATLLTDIPMLTLATGIPSTITTARGPLMLSLLLMPLLSLLLMLRPMLLCTVIPMVDTSLMPTLLTLPTTGIPMATVPTPTTITSARGLLRLSPTVDTTDMVATTDTPDLTTDTDTTIAVRQRTQQRRQNFTNQMYCLCYP